MKIANPIHRLQPAQVGSTAVSAKDSPGDAAAPAEVSVKIANFGNAADAPAEMDLQRVAELKKAIAEGRLEIRADRIADALIDSVRELLGK